MLNIRQLKSVIFILIKKKLLFIFILFFFGTVKPRQKYGDKESPWNHIQSLLSALCGPHIGSFYLLLWLKLLADTFS